MKADLNTKWKPDFEQEYLMQYEIDDKEDPDWDIKSIHSDCISIKSIHYSEYSCLWINMSAWLITAIAQFHFKYTKLKYPNDYEEYSYCFWRYLTSWIMNGIYMKIKKEKIKPFSELKNNFWFWVRVIDQFLVFETLLFIISFFRISTATCFVSMSPIVMVLLSCILLGEQFRIRYIYGIFICFFGVFLIVSNEAKSNTNPNTLPLTVKEIILGTFWGVVQLITVALHRVSSKLWVRERIDENAQIMYPAIACSILPLLCIVILGKQFSYGLGFVINCAFNGFWWVTFTRMLVISLRGVDWIKTTTFAYLPVATVFIWSAMFLGEHVYFSDVVGSLIILGYNLYNTWYVPQ